LKRTVRNISYFGLLLLYFSTFSPSLFAQPAGMPILTQSDRQVTLSITGGYFQKNINGITYNSPRYLLKGILGLVGFLDLFAEVGVAKVTLDISDGTQARLDGKYQLAYGGGLNIRYFHLPRYRFSLFISGQIFRFVANPSSRNSRILGNTEVLQVVELKYDWREVSLNTGFVKGWGVANFYIGLNAKIIQRLETKIDKIIVNGGGDSSSSQSGEYLSGLESRPFIGLDLKLPSKLTVSLELLARNRSDFVFYIGLSQTGSP
jgi:hypothetical protein